MATRLKATTVNDLSSKASAQLTVAAKDATIRIIYGRQQVWGQVYAVGFDAGALVVGVKWCMGGVWGIEEVEALYIDDALPVAGVTYTHYLGTATQTVSTVMQAALPGYSDTLVYTTPTGHQFGIAHTVIRIPTSAMTAPPKQYRAIIKGRKCFDVRTGLWAYTESPALQLHDLLTAPEIGVGMQVLGVEALADFNDTIMSDGLPRNRCSIVFDSPAEAMSQAALLAEYADCIFPVWEGAAIRLVPDAPVAGPLPIIDVDEIILDSAEVSVAGLMQAPTTVHVHYTAPGPGADAWPVASIPASLPEVGEGKISDRPGRVQLPGIQSAAQAYRVAQSRLARARNGGQVGLRLIDPGVRWQPGDVVLARSPRQGLEIPVRLTSHAMPSANRYQIRARPYLEAEYPDPTDAPGIEGTVPVGVIGFLLGSGDVPAGWAQVNDANDRLLRGAANDGEIGTTGGSNSVTLAGSTATDGVHDGASQFETWIGTVSGTGDSVATLEGAPVANGSHSHSYSRSVTVDPNRMMVRLVEKTGAEAILLPAQIATLCAHLMPYSDVSMTTIDVAGRLLGAAAALARAGTANQSASLTFSAAGAHGHNSVVPLVSSGEGNFTAREHLFAGEHDHAGSAGVALTLNPRRRRMHLYAGVQDRPVHPGDVFAWRGSIGSLPTGFYLCDGSNNTVDLRGYYVELATSNGGQALGDNTLAWSGTTTEASHSHKGNSRKPVSLGTRNVMHDEDVKHSHSITGSVAYTPPFYRLAFIQFNGA